MSALLLLATCLGAGYAVGRSGRAPPRLAQDISWFALNIALPALAVHLVSQLHFEAGLAFLFASEWALFAGAWLLALAAGKLLRWTPSRIGAVTLVAGLGNTAFLGYPLLEWLRGPDGVKLGVVADQAGSFVALATGGVVVASLYAGKDVRVAPMLRRIAVFPPFLGFVVGVLLALSGWQWAPLDEVLARLGSTLTPLAVFAIGMQLQWRTEPGEGVALTLALLWKMLVAPLLVFAGAWALGVSREVRDIATLQAAMAPMISAALLAEQEGLDPPLAMATLGTGILISLGSVPTLDALLRGL